MRSMVPPRSLPDEGLAQDLELYGVCTSSEATLSGTSVKIVLDKIYYRQESLCTNSTVRHKDKQSTHL